MVSTMFPELALTSTRIHERLVDKLNSVVARSATFLEGLMVLTNVWNARAGRNPIMFRIMNTFTSGKPDNLRRHARSAWNTFILDMSSVSEDKIRIV